MNRIPLWTTVFLTVYVSACGLVTRHPGSGYGPESLPPGAAVHDYFGEKREQERRLAIQDLGLSDTPMSPENEATLQRHIQIRRHEAQLKSNAARTQYYDLKPYLTTDEAKLTFLRLPTPQARQEWAEAQGLTDPNRAAHPPEIAKVIEGNDLVIGMTKKAVLESWGDPDAMAVAGNPIYGNERWTYRRTLSSAEGYEHQQRFIYFEGGRVAGWETH